MRAARPTCAKVRGGAGGNGGGDNEDGNGAGNGDGNGDADGDADGGGQGSERDGVAWRVGCLSNQHISTRLARYASTDALIPTIWRSMPSTCSYELSMSASSVADALNTFTAATCFARRQPSFIKPAASDMISATSFFSPGLKPKVRTGWRLAGRARVGHCCGLGVEVYHRRRRHWVAAGPTRSRPSSC